MSIKKWGIIKIMAELLKYSINSYHLNDLYITPYPSESILAYAYLRMEKEGLTGIVFHEGNAGVGWFINTFIKQQSILACWFRARNSGNLNDDLDLAGLAWFNSLVKIGESGKNKAEAGYVFFRDHQTPKKTIPLAAICMEWAFDHLNVDLILGMTPEKNKLACYFLRWLGMKPSGPIESFTTYPSGGEICAAYVSSMTKERWQTQRGKWFAVDNPQ
jgi:hypothetical protein